MGNVHLLMHPGGTHVSIACCLQSF